MEIFNLSLPATNRFASNYLKQTKDIQPFFHYPFAHSSSDSDRLMELHDRSFPREEVAKHIEDFMGPFPTSKAVYHSIEKLKQKNSVVVIGGQQAGILTGPLYTLHKVISIIKLAEEKEKKLNVPVVPVFWIAGEDHDFQEVNHLFFPNGQKIDKWTYPEKILQKKMVTEIELNKDICLAWAENLIEHFGETSHTKPLLQFVRNQIEKSNTFVEFFAHIIMELFKDYGLLIVDSGNVDLRKIEKDIMIDQIMHHDSITYLLIEQQKKINANGFPNTIETNEKAANLFYNDPRFHERILLEFDRQSDRFVGKNGVLAFSKEELIEIARTEPERLSNNVVTRPLTQELLFPTIAFIAGPGEISYWAELKLVFEHFGLKMPPIVPRLNITLVDRSIESDLMELQLSFENVMSRGTNLERDQFLKSIKDREVEELFSAAINQLSAQYQLIEEKTARLDKGLLPLLKKNETLLIEQIDFMKTKLEESIKNKHRVVLNKFDRIDLALRPDGFPQERIWNVFYYLNEYGFSLIHDLMELPYIFDGSHKIIKM
jgi:bacillithiol synthase